MQHKPVRTLLRRLAIVVLRSVPPTLRCGRSLVEDHGTGYAADLGRLPDGPRMVPSSNVSPLGRGVIAPGWISQPRDRIFPGSRHSLGWHKPQIS